MCSSGFCLSFFRMLSMKYIDSIEQRSVEAGSLLLATVGSVA